MNPLSYVRPVWEPIDSMTPEAIAEQLADLRKLWDNTDEQAKYFIVRAGRDVVITTRWNKRLYGVLNKTTFKPDSHYAYVQRREWNPVTGRQQDEINDIVMPDSQVVTIEAIIETEEVVNALMNGPVSPEVAGSIVTPQA